MEMIKEKRIRQGIEVAYKKSISLNRSIIFSYSFRIEVKDILPLLTHPSDKNTERTFWCQPSKGSAYAGLGAILKFENLSISRLKSKIKSTMKGSISNGNNALIGPRIIGGLSFNDYSGEDKTWDSFPRSKFIIPECLATLTDDGAWLTISKLVKPDNDLKSIEKEMEKTISYYENRLPVTLPPISRVSVDKYRDIPSQDVYSKTIFSLLRLIRPNQMEKVVISRSHHVKVGRDFKAVSAMQILRDAYPNCISFCFSFPNEGIFFGSTPERLIRLKNNYVKTEALAGTIGRGNNMEEDRILAESLLDSHKEKEEHSIVREQIVRKLQPYLSDISHPKVPQIMKLKNVQHLQTPISGKLNNEMTILDLVGKLHPTSAVAGTPTSEAMKVINEMEKHDRGWYSGPIGWLDEKGDGEFYVALRSALVKDEEAHVFAGGGIVSESHPDKEWDETELKLQPILSALSGGQV